MGLDKNTLVFFLGGYDAEMVTIKNILLANGITKENIQDKELQWGTAKLSEYKEELSKLSREQIPVFIELNLDVAYQLSAIIIDHHNEKENTPSSIEQIAELLSIKLNRWQQLIAANDKGFIPAMERICATENEIKKVRDTDRRVQGVTEEEEKLAEKSIEKNKKEINGIVIVKSLAEKFSPITDRMYGKVQNLLVYSDNQLTFYGSRKNQLVKKYKNLIENNTAYYGGGDNGFFGIGRGKLSKEEILTIKDEIINMEPETNEKLYSHHIFIFPFKWRKWDVKPGASLKDKFDVKYFRDELLRNTNWKRNFFNLEFCDRYNEYNYFYNYVREILYDLGEELQTHDIDEDLINHFEYKIEKGITYNIKLYNEEKTYNLGIDSILLNVYSTGTAVLSLHLRNHNHPTKEDVLKINKFGRRFYVPFFDLEPDSIFTGANDATSKDKLLCATKKFEIPAKIWIGNSDLEKDDKSLYEDFEKYKDKNNYK
ncbi:MAG: hypothetical protein K8H86_07935, partial [Ignavibacteriaceae bacterium]|nr:hypothetical protein [Ignavibacteriaceae bacterium]